MQILVLTKPVPDPAAGAERLGPDFRLDRAASPTVVNGNDEYALEAALQLVEAHGGEVAILAMAPANATETMRKALAMGAQRGDPRHRPGARGRRPPDDDPRARRRRRRRRRSTCCSPGLDTSDGTGGAVAAGRRRAPRAAAAVRRRARSSPTRPPGRVRVQAAVSAKGYDLIEAPMPAVISCTQALGAPRYPSLKGIMAARLARDRQSARSADLGARRPAARRRRLGDPRGRRRPAAGARRGPRGHGAGGRRRPRDRRLPRRPEAHLMPAVILAVAEVADGALTRLSTEVATLARAAAPRRPAATAVGLVVDADPGRRGRRARRRTCRAWSR